MAYEQKPGQGSLFQNTAKEKDSHPDYRGDANIDGVTYEIAGWRKVAKSGKPYLSLSLKVKQERQQETPRDKAMRGITNMDDSIPF